MTLRLCPFWVGSARIEHMFEPIGSSAIPEVDPAAGAGDPVVPGSDDTPGPGLAAVLAGVDLTALTGDALAEVIAACERMTS